MKRLTLPLLALIPALYVAPLMASNLMVEGQVQTPGEYAWRDGLRLLDLTTSAGVSVNSWPLGAALLRESAEPDQRKLKAGVLFDLGTARVKAATIGDNSLTGSAFRSAGAGTANADNRQNPGRDESAEAAPGSLQSAA